MDQNGVVLNCYFHNIGAIGLRLGLATPQVAGCYFANGANSFTTALDCDATNGYASVTHNVFSMSGTSNAMDVYFPGGTIANNSVFTTGSGVGLRHDHPAFGYSTALLNNLFEGWTTGVLFHATPTADFGTMAGNAFFNCTTDYTVVADHILFEDNEALSVTPFDKSGSDTYALRATYFNAVDTGNVWSPYMGMGGAKGAIQPTPGGGATTLNMIVTGTSSLLKR